MARNRFEMVKPLALTGVVAGLVAAPHFTLAALASRPEAFSALLKGLGDVANVYSGLFTNIINTTKWNDHLEALAKRNHLLRENMASALLKAIKSIEADPNILEKPDQQLFEHWRALLKAANASGALLDEIVPVKFSDLYWDLVTFDERIELPQEADLDEVKTVEDDPASSLAQFLQDLINVNLEADPARPLGLLPHFNYNLLALWDRERAQRFAVCVLPRYVEAFSIEVHKGGPLKDAFDEKFFIRISQAIKRTEVVVIKGQNAILRGVDDLKKKLEQGLPSIENEVSRPQVIPKDWKKPAIFLGRDEYLNEIYEHLVRKDPQPVFVHGLFGVGKSALCEAFAFNNRSYFESGGYGRITLEPGRDEGLDDLLKRVAEKFGVDGTGSNLQTLLQTRLNKEGSPALLHIENIDWHEAARAVCAIRGILGNCRLIASGRLGSLGSESEWKSIALNPFSPAEALKQLSLEYRAAQDPVEKVNFAKVAERCGYLPQAIHLCAGHLKAGMSTDLILERLPILGPSSDADPLYEQKARAFLGRSFELSGQLFENNCQRIGRPKWPKQFSAFAAAPLSGAGNHLGSFVCGLSEEEFSEMMRSAADFSLIGKVAMKVDGKPHEVWVLHSLIRELIKDRSGQEVRQGRMQLSTWFKKRILAVSESTTDWNQVDLEQAALIEWLDSLDPRDAQEVCLLGAEFAELRGPWRAWARAAVRGFERESPFEGWANAGLVAAKTLFHVGELDQSAQVALAIMERAKREEAYEWVARSVGLVADVRLYQEGRRNEALQDRLEELGIYQKMQRTFDESRVRCEIALIHYLCQDFDTALDILQNQVLPALNNDGGFESLRLQARSYGQIADIYYSRGDLLQALGIRRNKQLAINARLRDTREIAMTEIAIADILCRLDQLDEAFRIYDEQLCNIKQIGDIRPRAIAGYGIAHILYKQGLTKQAVSLLRLSVLPIFERLGDVRELALTQSKLAMLLAAEGESAEADALCASAILVLGSLGVQGSLARARFRWARVKAASNHKQDAIRLANQTLIEAERLGLKSLTWEIGRFLRAESSEAELSQA